MATLIEDIYDKKIDKDIYKIKLKDLSEMDKSLLGIKNFKSYLENNLLDISFINRIPLQFILFRFKLYRIFGRELVSIGVNNT